MSKEKQWYSVRCLFVHPTRKKYPMKDLYEERITIWFCESWSEAYDRAFEEAEVYAKKVSAIFLERADSFHLFSHDISEGIEVWSIMRDSDLTPEEYENNFLITESDRCSNTH